MILKVTLACSETFYLIDLAQFLQWDIPASPN